MKYANIIYNIYRPINRFRSEMFFVYNNIYINYIIELNFNTPIGHNGDPFTPNALQSGSTRLPFKYLVI